LKESRCDEPDAIAALAADDQPETELRPHSMGTYSRPEAKVPPGAAAQLYAHVMPSPEKASVREAALNDSPRLPPVDPPELPVELGVAAEEATLTLAATLLDHAAEATGDVAKVVGTDTAAEELAPGTPPNEIEDRWKKAPAGTLELCARLTLVAGEATEDSTAAATLDAEDNDGATAAATLVAAGETVTVNQLVEVVVVVPSQELEVAAT